MKHNTRHWAGITAGILSLAGYASAATPGSEKYTYDASGNIIEKSIDGKVTKMTYDAANKVTSITSPSKRRELVNYDASGRPTSYKDASGKATRELAYGYADKILHANSGNGKAEFFYDAEGQLVGKSVAGKITLYAWDGNVMAAEGTNAFTNEAHVTGGVPAMTGDQNVVVSDYLGNTLIQGNLKFNSTAYGEGLEQGRFTGKTFVPEIWSYVFHHRTYSPEAIAWGSADPSGYPNGANRYGYVEGDPLSRVDTNGLFWDYAQTEVSSYAVYTKTTPVEELQLPLESKVTAVVQFKVSWFPDTAPTKMASSDKFVGSTGGSLSDRKWNGVQCGTEDTYLFSAPNSIIDTNKPNYGGTWTTIGPPTNKGYWAGFWVWADCTLALKRGGNTVSYTPFASYQASTHEVALEQ